MDEWLFHNSNMSTVPAFRTRYYINLAFLEIKPKHAGTSRALSSGVMSISWSSQNENEQNADTTGKAVAKNVQSWLYRSRALDEIRLASAKSRRSTYLLTKAPSFASSFRITSCYWKKKPNRPCIFYLGRYEKWAQVTDFYISNISNTLSSGPTHRIIHTTASLCSKEAPSDVKQTRTLGLVPWLHNRSAPRFCKVPGSRPMVEAQCREALPLELTPVRLCSPQK
ncbi:hypothetical protein BDV98DRAFT_125965 [Pterulicium gracile]|uniref:Uncharacterized protein n=1 Tax=Pterulicium gracile TaxID=1884261 RepID=A0A5C3QCR9_9AGAR|nr:hypothetical protein BDV98DRAFT_125965 [Pterula gracilis]